MRDVHVRWRDNHWSVEVDGEDEPRSVHTNRNVAWNAARDTAYTMGLSAVLHSRGGYVRNRTLPRPRQGSGLMRAFLRLFRRR